MSRAYVLDRDTLAVVGLIDQSYTKITYTRRYQAMDTIALVINRLRLYADQIQNGRLIYLPDEGDRVFMVEQVETVQSGERSKDEMIVVGRSMEGIAMQERLCLPPAGQSHDELAATPAESAIKHYVDTNAVSATDPDRNIPNLVIAADAAGGINVDTAARYQNVLDFCIDIGLVSGLGWEIVLDIAGGNFVFDTIDGVDRSASVFFDFAFETLEKWDELASDLDSKTVAVVAGQGEGVDRDIVIRGSGVGFARREAFVDARDVELGNTTLLNARGDAVLAASTGDTALLATVHQFGSFRYREHWDLGDIVLVRNEERGIEYPSRIVEIEVTIDKSQAAPTVVATLGRPFPTLKSRSGGTGGVAVTADKGGSGGSGVPVGTINMWPAAAAPTDWLICDGSSLLRADYPDLFTAIGTTYGAVDGTHFNIPDLRDRFIVGKGVAAGWDTLGETGGATTATPSAHSVTQPSAHAALSHTAHSVTQPSAHSDHAAQSHSAHAGGAVSAHAGTAVSAHSGTAVSAHAAHTHETPFIDDDTHTLSTTSAVFGQGANRTRAWTGSFSSASGSYPVAQVSDTTVGAHTVTQPAAHTVTQPSDHTFTQPSAHSDHAALAHSAHTGTAVAAHSDHASQTHTGTAVADHSAVATVPPYFALNFIILAQ